MLNERRDLYYSLCCDFLNERFNGKVDIRQKEGRDGLVLWDIPAQDTDSTVMFDFETCQWVWMDGESVFLYVYADGQVNISYPDEDPEHGGMNIRVAHPREVAELLDVFLDPKAATTPPAEDEHHESIPLGGCFDFSILMPDHEKWRVLNPAAIPEGAPDDFRNMLHSTVARNWDDFTMNKTIQATRFAEDWPELVASLPDATKALEAGYILDFEGNIRSGVDTVVKAPHPDDLFFDILLNPKNPDLSCFYLRELLSGHTPYREAIGKAIQKSATIEDTFKALSAIELLVPPRRDRQILKAIEHAYARDFLAWTAKEVATKDNFHRTVENTWHLVSVMQRMMNA